ncbi:unnamed protein product, partial [Brassica rapa subsp. trilocularis]
MIEKKTFPWWQLSTHGSIASMDCVVSLVTKKKRCLVAFEHQPKISSLETSNACVALASDTF